MAVITQQTHGQRKKNTGAVGRHLRGKRAITRIVHEGKVRDRGRELRMWERGL
jgi:hypothetical protein